MCDTLDFTRPEKVGITHHFQHICEMVEVGLFRLIATIIAFIKSSMGYTTCPP